jgi:hypothetical protein
MRKKKEKRRWSGALAGLAGLVGLTAGAVGTALLLRRRNDARPRSSLYPEYKRRPADRWARPGMEVTLRAELMPGRSRSERSFRVADVLPSGRVTLEGFTGEHAETEFEPMR